MADGRTHDQLWQGCAFPSHDHVCRQAGALSQFAKARYNRRSNLVTISFILSPALHLPQAPVQKSPCNVRRPRQREVPYHKAPRPADRVRGKVVTPVIPASRPTLGKMPYSGFSGNTWGTKPLSVDREFKSQDLLDVNLRN